MPPSKTQMPTTIDLIGEDLLHNIVSRLPATSFAYAACVSRSWNLVCERLLCRPKLSSACSFNPSLQVAVEEVVNKVLSEPIRPHFAIASVGRLYYLEDGLGEAHDLITAALGFQVPVITNRPGGIIGRDAISGEFKEIEWYLRDEINAIMLVVGFLPGLKVTTIPLLKQQIQDPETVIIDEFVTDIREFSTSVSGRSSPAAIIMFTNYYGRITAVIEKLDYAMSPETVIVGDTLCKFRCTNDAPFGTSAAVALVFAVDRNKTPDSTTAISSAAAVSRHLRSFNQGSNNATGGDKLEVFGGLIFTCPDIFSPGHPDINSSPFLDNFPGVTLGGTFCSRVIGCHVLTPYVKESQEQKAVGWGGGGGGGGGGGKSRGRWLVMGVR
ncbi:hypothetical protein M8C21_013496 [Ambrosia artemisiifolia]|uniref:F-box domain-containing protein n=1 Tax=Ambrosia artemisiifolia TaxID=4212 RepID=A0AAD5D8L6_AMBAR|nr:hypothetical protein M8C21_013496 [Ambrosia artemisiifolia]